MNIMQKIVCFVFLPVACIAVLYPYPALYNMTKYAGDFGGVRITGVRDLSLPDVWTVITPVMAIVLPVLVALLLTPFGRKAEIPAWKTAPLPWLDGWWVVWLAGIAWGGCVIHVAGLYQATSAVQVHFNLTAAVVQHFVLTLGTVLSGWVLTRQAAQTQQSGYLELLHLISATLLSGVLGWFYAARALQMIGGRFHDSSHGG